MGIFRFGKRENREKVIILDGAGKQEPETEKQLDQLISDLKEENEKTREVVEFRQPLPKAREWTETIETEDDEGDETMARVHHIKLQENFAGSILSGEKSFELRRNDRGYQKGDLIQFEVVNSVGVLVPDHELEGKKFLITYVLSGWGLQDGFVALAIREVKEDESVQ